MNVDLITPVSIPAIAQIAHSQQLMLVGSCFAEHIGKWLHDGGFQVDINPFGILYNPLSIATALKEIMSNKQYHIDDLFLYRGLWHSTLHHGSFSGVDRETVIATINKRLTKSSTLLKDNVDHLIITFGTAYVYSEKETGCIVGNCHKRAEKEFNRKRLTVEEIIEIYSPLIEQLSKLRPQFKIMFTVSPIRHLRDGLIENQLSKATLLLAINKLQGIFPDIIGYFPSYEILHDELRDYRFYADDLTHPSTLAIRYIQDRFAKACFSDETRNLMCQCESIHKSLAHRPLHPSSDEYKCFLEKLMLKINRLSEKYPYLESNFKEIMP